MPLLLPHQHAHDRHKVDGWSTPTTQILQLHLLPMHPGHLAKQPAGWDHVFEQTVCLPVSVEGQALVVILLQVSTVRLVGSVQVQQEKRQN